MTNESPTTNPSDGNIARKPSNRLGDIEDQLSEACDLIRIFYMVDGVNCRHEVAALGLVAQDLMRRVSGIKDDVESLRMSMLTPDQRAFINNRVPAIVPVGKTDAPKPMDDLSEAMDAVTVIQVLADGMEAGDLRNSLTFLTQTAAGAINTATA
jgi:hypothetical protein